MVEDGQDFRQSRGGKRQPDTIQKMQHHRNLRRRCRQLHLLKIRWRRRCFFAVVYKRGIRQVMLRTVRSFAHATGRPTCNVIRPKFFMLHAAKYGQTRGMEKTWLTDGLRCAEESIHLSSRSRAGHQWKMVCQEVSKYNHPGTALQDQPMQTMPGKRPVYTQSKWPID